MGGSIADLKSIFGRALEIRSNAEREAYLDQACGGEAELRAEVESLLQAQEGAGGFFDGLRPSPGPTVDQPSVSEKPGTAIGPYKLLEQIGEGGFGVVFLAEQTRPVRRRVALKVLKPGMDTRQVVARFEAERQALALMDHPNIAQVHDGGTTPDGRPFFVMELVKGVPITDYCDQCRLTTHERLDLFVSVCRAVQHAHQKGVIHRDIKPSNVLVAIQDSKPMVKVIDFGVAKAVNQRLSEQTLVTGFHQLIGTPLYMSPEQAEMSPLDVDTRADIYALGVLLYELLTGTTPFAKERLSKVGYDELRRILCEEEPPRPSARLSTLKDKLTTVAVQQRVEPRHLLRAVRGELDWIVMKCLEKDRSRRYETANGLARDVMRYLADEPVAASPPSTAYRLRKFLRRNKRTVLAALAFLAMLLGGIVGTTVGLVRALAAAESEKLAKTTAENRLKQIEAANEVLGSIFQDLDPREEERGGPELRVQLGQRLEQATRQLDGTAVGDPLTVARLQNVLGTSQMNLGRLDEARVLLEKALATRHAMLGPDHPDTLTSQNDLALVWQKLARHDRAEPLFVEVLQARTARLGLGHSATLTSKHDLAVLYSDQGKYDRAEPLLLEVVQAFTALVGADHQKTLVGKNNLALLYRRKSDFNRAELLYREVLNAQTARLGPDHHDTLITKSNLAVLYRAQGKLDQAESLHQAVMQARTAKLGPDHLSTLVSKNNLAILYRVRGKYDQAEPLFLEVLQARTARLGPNHPDTLNARNTLASLYHDQRKYEQAESIYREVVQALSAVLGPDHDQTLTSKSNLASLYRAWGRFEQAASLGREVLDARTARLGADHRDTLTSKNNLARVYEEQGKFEQAEPLYGEAVATARKLLGLAHPDTQHIIGNLSLCYEQMGQPGRAEPLWRELVDFWQTKGGTESPKYTDRLAGLGRNLLLQKKYAAAEPVLRACLAEREKKAPDAWATFNTRSQLGGALLGQQKYADAEPLLREGYNGMKQHEAKIPASARPRITEALEWLVRLYESWGKAEQAAEWRTKLEAHRRAEKKTDPPGEK
jgi:serine/threonine protein kinase/tetratricopeptide (TPR) repeat protein